MTKCDKDEALFDDLTGSNAVQPPSLAVGEASVSMLQVIKGDSTLRHVKELIFEYNQHLLELGCDVGSFQVRDSSRRCSCRATLHFAGAQSDMPLLHAAKMRHGC
jgi:hypothetical protein